MMIQYRASLQQEEKMILMLILMTGLSLASVEDLAPLLMLMGSRGLAMIINVMIPLAWSHVRSLQMPDNQAVL